MNQPPHVAWYDLAEPLPDVFGRPKVAPQGQDGTGHFNFYDNERSLSFQWDGHHDQDVVVSFGGYGEPIKWTFNFLEYWDKGRFVTHLVPSGPVFTTGDEMFSAAFHFQKACERWIKWMETHFINKQAFIDAQDEGLMSDEPVMNRERIDSYPGVYTINFDANNKNWIRDAAVNYLFLKGVQQHMNNVLEVRGHVFLNDVLDALNMRRTAPGAVVGWFKEEGSKIIDFHLPDLTEEGNIELTLQTDGVIFDKL